MSVALAACRTTCLPDLAAVESDLVAFLEDGLELGAASGFRFFVVAEDVGTTLPVGEAEEVFWLATALATEGVGVGVTNGGGVEDVGGAVVVVAGAAEEEGVNVGADEEGADVGVGSRGVSLSGASGTSMAGILWLTKPSSIAAASERC